MNYFNPNNYFMPQIPQFSPQQQQQSRQMPQVSEAQFLSFTSTLNKQSWQSLVKQARARGISDTDIEAGLNILLNKR